MITAGSFINPKGAAAMVGPSDLDTDTRFNNVICGVMWDALLEGDAPELAQALHYGKRSLSYEFSGLSAPDGTVIDEFYHHQQFQYNLLLNEINNQLLDILNRQHQQSKL